MTALWSALLVLMSGMAARAQGPAVTAFVNVNVVPMDIDQVLQDQTVVVDGEEISSVGPSTEVDVPPGAEIIEGDGAYLMPGLADMHAHLNVDPGPDFMRLFLAERVDDASEFERVARASAMA